MINEEDVIYLCSVTFGKYFSVKFLFTIVDNGLGDHVAVCWCCKLNIFCFVGELILDFLGLFFVHFTHPMNHIFILSYVPFVIFHVLVIVGFTEVKNLGIFIRIIFIYYISKEIKHFFQLLTNEIFLSLIITFSLRVKAKRVAL